MRQIFHWPSWSNDLDEMRNIPGLIRFTFPISKVGKWAGSHGRRRWRGTSRGGAGPATGTEWKAVVDSPWYWQTRLTSASCIYMYYVLYIYMDYIYMYYIYIHSNIITHIIYIDTHTNDVYIYTHICIVSCKCTKFGAAQGARIATHCGSLQCRRRGCGELWGHGRATVKPYTGDRGCRLLVFIKPISFFFT